jgi:hypothetical protein
MEKKNEGVLPEPKAPEEKAVWILDQMIRSSKIRVEYFKHVASLDSQYITANVETDTTTGIVTKNKDMYSAIHADFIFRVLSFIESLQGAMAVAWKYSAKGKPNLEEIVSTLIDPRGHRGNIEKILRGKTFTEKRICRLFAVPSLSKFEESTAVRLRDLLRNVFDRAMNCASYSKKFWDEYEDIRNVYVHNFRFIFIGRVEAQWKAFGDESVLGFLKDPSDLSGGMAFIGASQRVAMGDMVFLLSELERWIYNNLKVTILNKCKPVLPPYIPYLDEKQQREYEEIWKAQGYDYHGPAMEVRGRIKVDNQAILVTEFLGMLDAWGRSLRVYGKDGKIFRFPVKKLQQELKERIDKLAFRNQEDE